MVRQPPPVSYRLEDEIAVLTVNNPPVNALNQVVRGALLDALIRAERAEGVKALLLVGTGRAFVAGADVKEFGEPKRAPFLPDLCNHLEASPLIVVAMINGFCLGGGLEIAMSAHYRIALPSARLGLPEVQLGLIPGAGGTQRLPRLVGTESALELITRGQPIPAVDALRIGLLDWIEDGDPIAVALEYIRARIDDGAGPRPTRNLPAPEPVDWEAVTADLQRGMRGRVAPLHAVEAIKAGTARTFDEALAIERGIFNALLDTDQHKGLLHAFLAERSVSNLPEFESAGPRPHQRVGVIGAGIMGAGIAVSALLAGLDVTVMEKDQQALEKGRQRIAQILGGAVERGKLTASQFQDLLDYKLITGIDYADLESADLVIEAVVENLEVKKSVFRMLDKICKPQAILATNTSYLDINEIASATSRSESILGLHFFSPAHKMKLIEVVAGEKTAPDVVATGFSLAKRMGKIAVRSGVCHGFIGNRILHACRKAADRMVLEGATPLEIDTALEEFGYAMGPYAVADLAGLDIGWANRKRLKVLHGYDETAADFPDRLCETGALGRKSGKGYYLYGEKWPENRPNPALFRLIEEDRARRNIAARSFTPREIVRRYLATTVNEAARILEEGIARRPRDVDVILMSGYGFPRYRGGPCKWADLDGFEAVVRDVVAFSDAYAGFGSPASLLTELVSAGRCFEDLNV